MELSRYHELFFSEAATYLQQLNRHLLGLEGDAPKALEGAFRAAHTLKGMAATVGFSDVASRAHVLEDRLAELRGGAGPVSADVVDALLEGADGLERAVASAQDAGASAVEAPATDGRDAAQDDATTWTAPEGTGAVVHVALRPDAPLRSVRAAMVVRNVRGLADVLGHAPTDLGEDFSGDLVLFLKTSPEGRALEAAIRAAGEVETVVVEEVGAGVEVEVEAEATLAEDAAASQRFVRVERRHVAALADAVGELTALHGELDLAFRAGHGAGDALDRMRRLLAGLQTTALAVRLVPVGEVFGRFPRLVRDAARRVGKTVDLRVEGQEIELDRAILEGLSEPLVHLLRNAVDHGIESPEERRAAGKPARGRVRLGARHDRAGVLITVADDGRGVDVAAVRRRAVSTGLATEDEASAWSEAELLLVLSRPGFSAASKVSELSGRGVGLDVVASQVRSVGGALTMKTDAGRGTTFEMRLPVTLALTDAVWVAVGGERFAIPLTHVAEVRELNGRRRGSIRFRGETYAASDLGELLGLPSGGPAGAAVLVDVAGRRSALLVDALLGHERIVVKEFDVPREAHPLVSAATLRPDGRPALVLDPAAA